MKKVLALLVVLVLASSAALGSDPSYYKKKSTWTETMLSSREARICVFGGLRTRKK
jgi:hypothetical protein